MIQSLQQYFKHILKHWIQFYNLYFSHTIPVRFNELIGNARRTHEEEINLDQIRSISKLAIFFLKWTWLPVYTCIWAQFKTNSISIFIALSWKKNHQKRTLNQDATLIFKTFFISRQLYNMDNMYLVISTIMCDMFLFMATQS